MAALILSSISKEMMEIDGTSVLKALSTYYCNRHNENMSALVNVLDAYVSFNSETVQLQNIITGQLYSEQIFESLTTVEQLDNNLSE